jgi:sugar/nucleoside kinase (ribokinase family)
LVHVTVTPSPSKIVTIGHAIVDVLGHCTDEFLGEQRLTKGSMELVDEERAVPLYRSMVDGMNGRGERLVMQSGGSAANTAVVAAMLGAPTSFVGKVREDDLGHAFADDLHKVGVRFDTAMEAGPGPATGRCLINVTDDAERTMSTFLGAARGIRLADIDESLLSSAMVTYVEGYLWDEERAHEALLHAIAIVKSAGRRFSFTLSDSFLIDRFRAQFHELIPSSVDILFANEPELCSLYETTDFDEALRRVGEACEIATVTRGPLGSVVVHGREIIEVPAAPVEFVIDTTGAGDAYAGGFLAAFSEGRPLRRCAEVANLSAAEVIGRLGARPGDELDGLVHGLG